MGQHKKKKSRALRTPTRGMSDPVEEVEEAFLTEVRSHP